MTVDLKVGSTLHQGWSKVDIRRSIYTAAGTFELTMSPVWEPMPEEYALYPGEKCAIQIEKETLLTGHIDSIRTHVDAQTRSITVSGRDAAADIVDCSSLRQSRAWNASKLETIAKDLLEPFGIAFYCPKDTGAVFPTWGIGEESVFDNLSRAASLRGFLLISNGKGALVATRPALSQASIFINEKSGVLNCEHIQDYSNRFSQYITRGPSYGPTQGNEKHLRFEVGPIWDADVRRYRPILISQDGEIRDDVAKKRLNWEVRVRRAKSDQVELTLMGWKDRLGKLWNINRMISIMLPAIDVQGKYLITEVGLSLDEGGTKTTLKCESVHAADIDPTLEAREQNLGKALDQNPPAVGGTDGH